MADREKAVEKTPNPLGPRRLANMTCTKNANPAPARDPSQSNNIVFILLLSLINFS